MGRRQHHRGGLEHERGDAICANLLVQRGELDLDIEPIGERAREMLEAATAPKSYLMQEQTTTPLDMSAREFRAAELPAANGVTDARSLARMYASLIGDGVDGIRFFTDETVRLASAPQADAPDEVMGIHSRFGAGFYLYMEGSNMIQDEVVLTIGRNELAARATAGGAR